MKQIQSTSQFFEVNIPKSLTIFIYVIASFVFMFLLWGYFAKIEEVLSVKGEVSTINESILVTAERDGPVESERIDNNEYVEQGDVLFKFDTTVLENELEELKKIRSILYSRLIDYRDIKSVIMHKSSVRNISQEAKANVDLYRLEMDSLDLQLKEAKRIYNRKTSLSIESQIIQENEQLKNDIDELEISLLSLKAKYVSEIVEKISAIELEYVQIENQISQIKRNITSSVYKAPASGTVLYLSSLERDSFILSGTKVLKITSDITDYYYVHLKVDKIDIALLSPGQLVHIYFPALSRFEFGEQVGVIEDVPNNVLNLNDSNSIYRIRVKMNRDTLDKSGFNPSIMSGMVCEGRIVIRRKSLLIIILEKLDLIQSHY